MRFISFCSGIEAASVAFKPLGWECAAVSEIEPFACEVLKHHYPTVPNLGDMTKITRDQIEALGDVRVAIAGCPCQSFSVAGLREGLNDDRGNLTLHYVRLLRLIPNLEYSIYENVPGILSDRTNAFGCLLAGMVGADAALVPGRGQKWTDAGVVAGPLGTSAWRILDAQFFGLAQRRRRVFVLFSRGAGNWKSAEALLPLRARLSGNTPPRRASREGVAPTLAARTKGGGGLGTDAECGGALIAAPVRAASPASHNGGSYPTEGRFATEQGVAATLRSGSSNESSHGKHNCDQVIPILEATKRCGVEASQKDGLGIGNPGDPMFTLQASAQHGVFEPIPINMQAAAKNGLKSPNMVGVGNAGDPAYTVNASDRHAVGVPETCATITKSYATHHRHTAGNNGGVAEGQTMPETCGALTNAGGHAAGSATNQDAYAGQIIPEAIAFSQHQDGAVRQGDIAPTLSTNENASGRGNAKVMTQMRVRRLLPEEAEKLQGFPVGYTKIPYRGKPADKCPDSGRYKTLGNSFPVNVIRWIGERIIAVSK